MPSMVVDDLDIVSVTFDPPEADAPLVVDPDRPLPRAAAMQALEMISSTRRQGIESIRSIQLDQPALRSTKDLHREPPWPLALEHCNGHFAGEAPYHFCYVTRNAIQLKSAR